MAQTRLVFTWTITFDGDRLMAAEVLPDVQRVLAFWVDHPKYPGCFYDLSISGVHFGIMQVKLTVRGRDQWDAVRRSRWVARALASAAHVKYIHMDEPVRAKTPPHEHRGARRFEAPKYGGPACEARLSSRVSTVSG